MGTVRRNFRIDETLAAHLTTYSHDAICSEADIVNVALACLFSCGRSHVLDRVEQFHRCDSSQDFISDLLYEVA